MTMELDLRAAGSLLQPVFAVGKSRQISDITEVLCSIRRLCSADGCILWLWTEQGTPSNSRLFAAAEDFEPVNGQPAEPLWHYLLPDSPSTCAVREDAPQRFIRLPDERFPGDPDRQAMVRLGIRSFCTVPVRWPNALPAEGALGAVNFYRRSEEPFSEQEFSLAKSLAPLVPLLLDDLINHASFHLLRQIFDLLHSPAALPNPDLGFWTHQVLRTLQTVLTDVQETFNCLECSVYMIKRDAADGTIHLVSTIWPWRHRSQPASYAPGVGLTGYCGSRTTPICIFDLGRFEEDLPHIREKYPDIDWSVPFDLKVAAREVLTKGSGDKLPPLSFLAAPIVDHGRTLGVLRCCVARSAPYYFNQRQLDLLCLVAGLIGEWCGAYFRLRLAQERRVWLQSYVRTISALNGRAHEAAVGHKRDFESLFPKALEAAGNALPEAYGLAAHLASSDNRTLRFAQGSGQAWTTISSKEIQRRQAPVSLAEPGSPLVEAFSGNTVVSTGDLGSSNYRLSPFPEAAGVVVAPISSGSRKYGVLTIAFAPPGTLSEQAVTVAELLGRQLGLYLFLGETITELREKKEELERTVEVQQQAFENLNHQLKTPVFLARRAARHLMSRKNLVDTVREIPRLNGQLRRAEQVVTNIRMFYDLARGRSIHPNRTATRPEKLLERLSDTVRSHNLFSLNPLRGIHFTVADESPRLDLPNVVAWLDLELLDQMLDDLLDNAEKYGDPNTVVTVRMGVMARGQWLYVSVSNYGKTVSITSQAAKTLAERGQRGDTAVWRGQEGSGIGLYIVREILTAHHGRLEIYPTNEQNITEFRLVFPTGPPDGSHENSAH